MLYHLHDLRSAALAPAHLWAEINQHLIDNPFSPVSYTPFGRTLSAGMRVLERSTRHYQKPSFDIKEVKTEAGETFKIKETVVLEKPFCHLKHFKKEGAPAQPRMLVVAPLSGHYATLLRDTVRSLVADHDVYITEWQNCRDIPLIMGSFTLEDYIDYLLSFIRLLGPNLHTLAVCQPSVPLLAAASLLATLNDECQLASMTLMGGPIDARINPTKVNLMAKEKSIEWFENKIVSTVPFYYAGFLRPVIPGFVMLRGFMSLNLGRHFTAHVDLFKHLIQGDEDNAETLKKFYDEYLSVMDLPADYYLDSVKTAFKEFLLPKGLMKWRGIPVKPQDIQQTALLTIEGEKDDISGVGQTQAAQGLCTNIPSPMKKHHLQPKAGHYGIFNGSRWRNEVYPVIRQFVQEQEKKSSSPAPLRPELPRKKEKKHLV